MFAKTLKRDSPCPYCGKIVFGVARRLTQCPVIVQVALLHQMAVLEVDPYDEQSKPVHINAAQAARLLTNYYEEASHSEQVPGLLHKCFICQADIFDIQTWRRHMKQHHSQKWKLLEGSLKSAVMAQPLPRPCPYCKTQYQKTPATHVGKCLARQQLLAIRDSPQERIDHGWSSCTDPPALGEPKPIGPSASTKGAEEGEWKRGGQIREEPPTTEADNSTTTRSGVGGRAPARSAEGGYERRAENASTSRTCNTNDGGGPQLRVTSVHARIINPPAVVSRESGMEGETRGSCDSPLRTDLMTCILLELQARLQKADTEPLRTLSLQAGWQTPDHKWQFVAWHPQDRKLMPTTRNPTPHQEVLKTVQELSAGAHPGGGEAKLRAPLPLHQTAQRELPDGVSDHAAHAVYEAGGSQATQPLRGAGGPVGNAAHRRADQAGAQETRKARRGAPQAPAKTLVHYFLRGAATGPRAAETGPIPNGRAGHQDDNKAATSGHSQFSSTEGSEQKTAPPRHADAREASSIKGETDAGKSDNTAEAPANSNQFTAFKVRACCGHAAPLSFCTSFAYACNFECVPTCASFFVQVRLLPRDLRKPSRNLPTAPLLNVVLFQESLSHSRSLIWNLSDPPRAQPFEPSASRNVLHDDLHHLLL